MLKFQIFEIDLRLNEEFLSQLFNLTIFEVILLKVFAKSTNFKYFS